MDERAIELIEAEARFPEALWGRFGKRSEMHLTFDNGFVACSATAKAFDTPATFRSQELVVGDEICLECLGIYTGHEGTNEAGPVGSSGLDGRRQGSGRRLNCGCGYKYKTNNSGHSGTRELDGVYGQHLARQFSLDGIDDEDRWPVKSDEEMSERERFMAQLKVGDEVGVSSSGWYNVKNGFGKIDAVRITSITRGDAPIRAEREVVNYRGEPYTVVYVFERDGRETSYESNRAAELMPLSMRDLLKDQ